MIQQLIAVRNVFIDIPKEYELICEAFEKTNEETQDLLHVLELGTLNAIEMTKVTKRLRKVRQERRILKDEIEVMKQIINLSGKKPSEHLINSTIGNIRKIEERKGKRVYNMRVCKDLQKFIK